MDGNINQDGLMLPFHKIVLKHIINVKLQFTIICLMLPRIKVTKQWASHLFDQTCLYFSHQSRNQFSMLHFFFYSIFIIFFGDYVMLCNVGLFFCLVKDYWYGTCLMISATTRKIKQRSKAKQIKPLKLLKKSYLIDILKKENHLQ